MKRIENKIKGIVACLVPALILIMVITLRGKVTSYNTKIENRSIATGYMKEEIQKLIDSDDKNLQSTKYLITDDTIDRILENTSISDFKEELGKKVKIYKDESLLEEIEKGIIKTGMVLEYNDDIYTLIVSGDVNKDGKVNQIDISKIIRNEIDDISAMKAAEVGKEKIIDKIVYGKYSLSKVDTVKSPKIEITAGEIGDNEWYVGDVELKITEQDEEGERTVYKIKGTEEKNITQITDNEKILLTKDGVYKVIAYTYGKEGNKSQVTEKIIKINKLGIEANISYSIEEDTIDPVVATVTFNKEGVTITNNDGKTTYKFIKNGEYTFEYVDESGRRGSITAAVDWIRYKEITGKDGEWKYFVNEDNTIQLTQYLGTKTEVVVPANYDGYEVYAIGNQYAGTSDNVKYNVFGEKSLENDKITKITIEEGIKEIKTAAFSKCTALSGKLVLPSSLISIGDISFNQCTNLTGDLIIPNNVVRVGRAAFQGCSGFDGKLVLSSSLTKIDPYAFNKCSGLTGDLIIPDSVTSIGRTAFQGCSGFDGKLVLANNLTSIEDYTFNKCSGLTGDLIIPDSVVTIGSYAFNLCSGLTGDLIIPDSVTAIGRTAFQGCSGFDGKLVLSNNLTSIEDYTFNKCSGLTGDLVIPDSVTTIGTVVFQNCSGFDGKLVLSNNLTSIKDYAFNHCSGLIGDLIIPDSVTEIGIAAFQDCGGFDGKIVLSNNLTSIGEYAFNKCSGLTGDLIIPDSVTEIGKVGFQSMYTMTGKLKLSKNLKKIGSWAFYNNSFTGILELPEGLETLGEAAFGKNIGFENTTIVIPSTLEKIGVDREFNGENIGLSTHDFYNLGANIGNFEAFQVADGNENFVAVDGVLYTKDKKRLVSYPKNKKDTTYEILEGVVTLDELSISSNMILDNLIIPDSLSMDIRSGGIRMINKHVLTAALYNYNSVQNIIAKDTNPNYTSVDGVLYTKDMKEMVYVSSGRTKEVIIPDGVEKIRDDAVFWNQTFYIKVPKIYIPASVIDISDSTMSYINNGFIIAIEVAEDNPVFTVDSDNKLIKK